MSFNGIDFNYNDIDKMIEILKLVKSEINEFGDCSIYNFVKDFIIQASDRDHIWIEPITNAIG